MEEFKISLDPSNNLTKQFTCRKRNLFIACYLKYEGEKFLIPANPKVTPYKFTQYDEFVIEGVVSYSLLDQRKQNHIRVDRLQQLLRVLRKGLLG